jgi:nitrate/nitrite-specific signal transduction histidine kinase
MNHLFHIRGRLIWRYTLLFTLLGLLPAIIALATPLIVHYYLKAELVLLNYIELIIFIGLSFLVIVAIGGWITFTGLALPIQEIVKGAEILASGDFEYRIPGLTGDNEISNLGETFNHMADAVRDKQNECVLQQNALQEMLSRRETEFSVLAQVAALINQPSDALTNKLTTGMQILHQLFKTDMLAVFLLHNSGDFAFSAHACNAEDEPLFTQHCKDQVDLPLLKMALETRDVVRIPNIAECKIPLTPRQREGYQRLNVHQMGVKPIFADQQMLGVLLLMRHQFKHISPETMGLLNALTTQIAILIQNANLKSLSRDLVIMEERRRLAHELHDAVTQSLFSLSMAAESLKKSIFTDERNTLAALDVISTQTTAIQRELRSLINELRPLDVPLEDSLDKALKRHVNSLKQVTGANVFINIQGDTRNLPSGTQQAINRIAQEALSNVMRHAQATRTQLEIIIDKDKVQMSITDNGVGMDLHQHLDTNQSPYGLTSMRERAEWLGGTFEVQTAPGKGVKIFTILPLSGTKTEDTLE